MLIYMDAKTLSTARLINLAVEIDGLRHYYLLPRQDDQPAALLVLRAGLDLVNIRNASVDASIGSEIAWQGFAAEEDVGKKRTKITVYKVHRQVSYSKPARSLAEVLATQSS